MKNLFLNHKYQASCITLLVFIPLIFTILHSNSFFKKMKIKNEDIFSLTIKQFTQTNSTTQSTPDQVQTKNYRKIKNTQPNTPIQTPIISNQEIKTPAKVNPNTHSKITTKSTQNKDNRSILKQIEQAIQQAQIYPRQAKKMRMQGIVKVEFLWKNKTLSELKIIQSSGYDLLDKNALKSIRKASLHFPYHKSDLRITLPIIYNLS